MADGQPARAGIAAGASFALSWMASPCSRPAKPTTVKDDEWLVRSWKPFSFACLGSRGLANACPGGTEQMKIGVIGAGAVGSA
jgi:hypothetical protein